MFPFSSPSLPLPPLPPTLPARSSSRYVDNAIAPEGKYHGQFRSRFANPDEVPTRFGFSDTEAWLWGVGGNVLQDTRVGEYQLGMGFRYTKMKFVDDVAKADAEQAIADPAFEARIVESMKDENISYYGRLVMSCVARDLENADMSNPKTGGGSWIVKARYGNAEDAKKGRFLIQDVLYGEEYAKWFSKHETISGTVASTFLVGERELV